MEIFSVTWWRNNGSRNPRRRLPRNETCWETINRRTKAKEETTI